MLPISWAHLRTHVVPQFCLVNLDHHHITIVCQVLIESLRVGFQEFSLFHRANLFLLERRTSTQHLPRNVQSWNFQNPSFHCALPLCFSAKRDESSESSQKKVKNAICSSWFTPQSPTWPGFAGSQRCNPCRAKWIDQRNSADQRDHKYLLEDGHVIREQL